MQPLPSSSIVGKRIPFFPIPLSIPSVKGGKFHPLSSQSLELSIDFFVSLLEFFFPLEPSYVLLI